MRRRHGVGDRLIFWAISLLETRALRCSKARIRRSSASSCRAPLALLSLASVPLPISAPESAGLARSLALIFTSLHRHEQFPWRMGEKFRAGIGDQHIVDNACAEPLAGDEQIGRDRQRHAAAQDAP